MLPPFPINKVIMQFGTDIFREIINEVDVNEIPVKYISAAIYMDDYGEDQFVMGEELEKLVMRRAPYDRIVTITVILNAQKITEEINKEVTALFETINSYIDNKD